MSASFSTWLSVGVGSRGTRRVDSTRALPCQEVSDADCRGNWKRPRLQAGEDLVNRGEQLPKMRVWALALTRNATAADDLVQDVALKTLIASDSFVSGTNFSAWVHRIMVNHFIS